MTTIARPTSEVSCHWYSKDGEPVYEVKRATGEGMRPTTLADARKLKLLPSVTTILGVLHKEALVQWKCEQAVLACLTTKQNDGESLDDFVKRVLHTERVQDQESDIAKARGTQIHKAIEAYLTNDARVYDEEAQKWMRPAVEFVCEKWKVLEVEKILVGNGYAGKCDFIGIDDQGWEWIIDFKTTKRIPKDSYWEHQCQTAAYLKCRHDTANRHANIYISTVKQGEFAFCDNGDYGPPYEAFACLVKYWQISNGYFPGSV